MQNLLHFLVSPEMLGIYTFLGSSVFISIVAQWLKRLGKLESEKIIQFLVTSLSVMGGLLEYISTSNLQSISVLVPYTAQFVGASQLIYMYGTKPLTNWVDKVNAVYEAGLVNTSTSTTTASVSTPPTPPNEFNL